MNLDPSSVNFAESIAVERGIGGNIKRIVQIERTVLARDSALQRIDAYLSDFLP